MKTTLVFEDLTVDAEIVDELPNSGRLVITDSITIDGIEYYGTVVKTRSGRLYAKLVTVESVRAHYGI